MRYHYYPGCSLAGTAVEYDRSTRSLMASLGVDLLEIEDWTCCGASAASALSRRLSTALPARVLAAAEAADPALDICVPCSACYLNLKKVTEKTRKDPALLVEINEILAEDHLQLASPPRVRHLLDVLSVDIRADRIAPRVVRPMKGWTVAPYYGCQCLRPYAVFDDPERPDSMTALIEAAGAAVYPWHMGAKCCGASLMNTRAEVALKLVGGILEDAAGADAIVTVCPMCQMNLEGYQNEIAKRIHRPTQVPVLYLPQLLGLAVGLTEKDVGLSLNLSIDQTFEEKLGRPPEMPDPADSPRVVAP